MKVTQPDMIRRRRSRLRFTQADLAQLAGVSQQFISLLETGSNRYCSRAVAEKIAMRLDIDLEDAFTELEDRSAPEHPRPARASKPRLAA